ncbi:periodic tryptophan protein 2 homolog isoform X2 [Megachile rotundata]|uniref:periodic tryptophan protein 2 homolog isoform X2 n=1 Tax=Megachile rotundata TaxID=143995 RepID=UPI000614B068|nr:PREDICTED: periodic tryptophan protein 2 homolog isoform X2 [Megachile rotundata]
MKFAYKFNNLLGAVYRKGNLIFTPDGSTVISPVGNRITVYDLKNNKSNTLPIESTYNYTCMDLSPNGTLLIAINAVGEAYIISMMSKRVIHKYHFKQRARCVKFSPDGKHFAVCKGHKVFIFNAPNLYSCEYNPFIMEHVFARAVADTTCIDWSYDSKLIAVGSKDMSIKVYGIEKFENFRSLSLGSHSHVIVACFFEKKSYDLSTISKNGRLSIWECTIDPDDLVQWEPHTKRDKKDDSDTEDDVDVDKAIEKTDKQIKAYERNLQQSQNSVEADQDNNSDNDTDVKRLRYKRLSRHYLANIVQKEQKEVVKLTAAAYHKETSILIVGFNNGSFYLYEMPEVNMIHSLSISQQYISSISVNSTGDWIALGCSTAGQLLVWEWQSETYAMKQQGHSNNMNSIAYSPDGQYIVTGGDDGKVKLWNTMNGFCSITFHEHTSTVTSVLFSHNRKFIVSASLDGTVRAYDLARYRNFKTLTSPRPVQFSCVALDSSDEFLAAGGQDVFEIYLWSLKLGTLLEILSGHEGPVVSLAFNPSITSTELASVSWDKTLKIWNAIESGSAHETIQLTSDGLFVIYKPNGEEVAVATLDGHISFFNCKTAGQIGSIEGRNDLGSGRSATDLITAKKSLQGKAFTSLCYSADGTCILAGGQSKNICIYNVQECMLVKKFVVTQNKSLDGVTDYINKRNLTEFGNKALIEKRGANEGGNVSLKLPGVRSGDMASRNIKPEIRVYSLQFSPTGQAWAAATTEGLLIYALDVGLVFDPFQLELGITPETVKIALNAKEYSKALMMSLRLNEKLLIQRVIESIPLTDTSELESTRHIHFYLLWIETILTKHGSKINSSLQMPILLMLQKNMQKKYDDISKICDFNQYTMSYLKKLGEFKAKKSIIAVTNADEESVISSIEEMDID